MTVLKIRKFDNSLGVVLPDEVLAHWNIGEGDTLLLSETPDGFRLEVFDEALAEQVEAGRSLARRYSNALRELAR